MVLPLTVAVMEVPATVMIIDIVDPVGVYTVSVQVPVHVPSMFANVTAGHPTKMHEQSKTTTPVRPGTPESPESTRCGHRADQASATS